MRWNDPELAEEAGMEDWVPDTLKVQKPSPARGKAELSGRKKRRSREKHEEKKNCREDK